MFCRSEGWAIKHILRERKGLASQLDTQVNFVDCCVTAKDVHSSWGRVHPQSSIVHTGFRMRKLSIGPFLAVGELPWLPFFALFAADGSAAASADLLGVCSLWPCCSWLPCFALFAGIGSAAVSADPLGVCSSWACCSWLPCFLSCGEAVAAWPAPSSLTGPALSADALRLMCGASSSFLTPVQHEHLSGELCR